MNSNYERWFVGIKKCAHVGTGRDIEAIVALFCENIEQAQNLLKEVRGVRRDKFPKELRSATELESKIINKILLEEQPYYYCHFKYIKHFYRIDITKWNEKKLYFTKE